MKVQVKAQITKVSTLADGSVKTEAVHPELPPAEMAVLFELRKSQGWWLFSSNEIEEKDVPHETVLVHGKSQSQRLRGAIFRYWESQGGRGDQEQFYQRMMEQIIEQVKQKIS